MKHQTRILSSLSILIGLSFINTTHAAPEKYAFSGTVQLNIHLPQKKSCFGLTSDDAIKLILEHLPTSTLIPTGQLTNIASQVVKNSTKYLEDHLHYTFEIKDHEVELNQGENGAFYFTINYIHKSSALGSIDLILPIVGTKLDNKISTLAATGLRLEFQLGPRTIVGKQEKNITAALKIEHDEDDNGELLKLANNTDMNNPPFIVHTHMRVLSLNCCSLSAKLGNITASVNNMNLIKKTELKPNEMELNEISLKDDK